MLSISPRSLMVWSAVALLAACASPGPEPTPLGRLAPAQLGLATPDHAVDAIAGWSLLGDAQLTALINQALAQQPSLAVARARVARAAALSQQAEADALPQASLSADLSRQRYTANGLVPQPVAGHVWNSGTLQIGASWSPDFFGQHAAELSAALGQTRAAQADAAAAALALSAQLAHGYVALARLLAVREVVEQQMTQRQQLQALVRQRVAAGLDTRTEQVQADGPLPEGRAQLEALDEQISLTRHQLAALCGQGPQSLNSLTPHLADLTLVELPRQLGADLLGRRPEVVAARWRIEAAVDDVAVARTQFYPNINIGAFVGLSALGLDRVLEGESRQFGVAPALRLPLFEGGRLRAHLRGQQAALDQAVAQYNGLVVDSVREASDAVASLQSLQRQTDQQAAALAAADAGLSLAQQRQAAGLGNAMQVLAAQTPVLAQRRQMTELRARVLDARVSLIKALGGGWSEDTVALSVAAPTVR
jgi:NodT family efflux transporter outer membrane factor (OMF) lipoprotein